MKSPLECLKRGPKDGHASSQCRGPRRAPVSFYCANIELYKHMSLIQPSNKTTRRFFFKKSERTDRYRSGFYLEGGVSDQIHMRATYPPTDHRDPLCVPSTTCAMCCARRCDICKLSLCDCSPNGVQLASLVRWSLFRPRTSITALSDVPAIPHPRRPELTHHCLIAAHLYSRYSLHLK